jgi:GTP-binding protein HflX
LEKTRDTLQVRNETAVLVSVHLPDRQVEPAESLAELESLVTTAGALVVGRVYQKRASPHPACYIGEGKARQVVEHIGKLETKVDTIIFDNDLSPAQIRELEKIFECKVLDRSELILDIFASRAQTYEAKLQVELAQLQYTYPRLTRMWTHLDTVVGKSGGAAGAVGGIGTRGPGEKQLEIDRRLVQKRLSQLRKQIQDIDQRKQRQVKSRQDHFTVSLVGYTNAGKSTLLNLLTGSDAYVENKLFATLDTKTAKWNLGKDLNVLLSDTVGFVRDLPHHLVASFRATLEEAIHADLLLHVVDVSHPQAELQMRAAHAVLAEIGCEEKDILLLFNKVDRQSQNTADLMQTLYPEALPISAKKGIGIDKLVATVVERVRGEILRLRVVGPMADGRIRNFLQSHGEILTEDYTDTTVTIEAHLGRRQLPGLERLKPTGYEIIS